MTFCKNVGMHYKGLKYLCLFTFIIKIKSNTLISNQFPIKMDTTTTSNDLTKLITTKLPGKPLLFEFSDEKNHGKVQSMESSSLTLLPNQTFSYTRKRGSWDVTKIQGW